MKWALLIGSVIALSASQLYAIPVSVSASAPNTDVMISQTSQNQANDARRTADSGANWRDFVQTFTVPASANPWSIQKISVLVEQDPARITSNLPFRINLMSTGNVNTPTGSSLIGGGESATLASITPSQQLWLTFDITDTQVNPGDILSLRFGFDAPAGSTKRLGDEVGGVYNDTQDPYADGRAFRLDTNVAGAGLSSSTDLAFVIQAVQVVVPEPSSVALAGMGVVGLVGYGLRRRKR